MCQVLLTFSQTALSNKYYYAHFICEMHGEVKELSAIPIIRNASNANAL